MATSSIDTAKPQEPVQETSLHRDSEEDPKEESRQREEDEDEEEQVEEGESEVFSPESVNGVLDEDTLAAKIMNDAARVTKNRRHAGSLLGPGLVEGLTSDNKLVLGSGAPLASFVAAPDSRLSRYWNVILFCSVVYVCTETPYRTTFLDDLKLSTTRLLIDALVDIIFILDLVLNMWVLAYVDDKDEVVTDRNLIARKYLRSWFLLDLISCYPTGILELIDRDSSESLKFLKVGKFARILRLFKLLRLLRLVRVIKMNPTLHRLWQDSSSSSKWFKFFKFMFIGFVGTHLTACLWFVSHVMAEDITATWVYRFDFQDKPPFTQYMGSMYWALTTFTTVGYGDITAETDLEYAFAVVVMVGGVLTYGILVSFISSQFIQADAHRELINEQLRPLAHFAMKTHMSVDVYTRLRRHIEHRLVHNPQWMFRQKMESLFDMMQPQLRFALCKSMHKGKHMKTDLMTNRQLNQEFAMRLSLYMQEAVYSQGDIVYLQEEHSARLYLLLRGAVGYLIMAPRMDKRASFRAEGKMSRGGKTTLFSEEDTAAAVSNALEVNAWYAREGGEGTLGDQPEPGDDRVRQFARDSRMASLLAVQNKLRTSLFSNVIQPIQERLGVRLSLREYRLSSIARNVVADPSVFDDVEDAKTQKRLLNVMKFRPLRSDEVVEKHFEPPFNTLHKGATFGDVELVFPSARLCSCRVEESDTLVMQVEKQDMYRLMTEFPDAMHTLRQEAEPTLKTIQEAKEFREEKARKEARRILSAQSKKERRHSKDAKDEHVEGSRSRAEEATRETAELSPVEGSGLEEGISVGADMSRVTFAASSHLGSAEGEVQSREEYFHDTRPAHEGLTVELVAAGASDKEGGIQGENTKNTPLRLGEESVIERQVRDLEDHVRRVDKKLEGMTSLLNDIKFDLITMNLKL